MKEDVITVLEAATRKGVSPTTIRRWIKDGTLSSPKEGFIVVNRFFSLVEKSNGRSTTLDLLRMKMSYEDEIIELKKEIAGFKKTFEDAEATMEWLRERLENRERTIKEQEEELQSSSHGGFLITVIFLFGFGLGLGVVVANLVPPLF